jgi:hypothetical protein
MVRRCLVLALLTVCVFAMSACTQRESTVPTSAVPSPTVIQPTANGATLNPAPQVVLLKPGTGERRLLASTAGVGQVQTYTITQTSASQGQGAAAEIVTQWEFSAEVTAASDGTATVVFTCTAVDIPVFNVSAAPEIDAEEAQRIERIMGPAPEGAAPTAEVANPLASLTAAVGVPVTVNMDRFGNMDFDRNPAPVEVGQYNQALATFMSALDAAVIPWPDEPVGVGAVWEVQRALGSVGNSGTQLTQVTASAVSGSRAAATLGERTVAADTAPLPASTVLNDVPLGDSTSGFSGAWRWEQSSVLPVTETTRTISTPASATSAAISNTATTKLTRQS